MMKKFDFIALSIGALIYFVGGLILGLFLVAILDVMIGEEILDYEYTFELLHSILLVFLAGYYTYKHSRVEILNQGLVLGIILFLFNLPGTLNQIGDPKGDPFLWNISYDISLIIIAYLGSRTSMRRLKRNRMRG